MLAHLHLAVAVCSAHREGLFFGSARLEADEQCVCGAAARRFAHSPLSKMCARRNGLLPAGTRNLRRGLHGSVSKRRTCAFETPSLSSCAHARRPVLAPPGSQIVLSMLLRARATQANLSTASLVGTTARVAGSLAASPSFLFEPFLAHSCSGSISRPPQWQDIADFRPSFLASPSACVLLKHV